METAHQKMLQLTKSPGYGEVLSNLVAQGVVELKTYDRPCKVIGLARDKNALQNAIEGAKGMAVWFGARRVIV